MGKRYAVRVTFDFYGKHYYSQANGEEEYLKNYHRHKFIVEATKYVRHGDRAIEFIAFKNTMIDYIHLKYGDDAYGSKADVLDLKGDSCEMISLALMDTFDLDECWVSEDGECAGGIIRVEA